MWSLENSKNNEAAKIRWECVPYFRGDILDIGCGPYKCFPHWVGLDNGHHWGTIGADLKCEATDLGRFTSRSHDGVFSSHLLEHVRYEHVPETLREWCRVIKDGGHLMLYLPDEAQYPKVGDKWANHDHKWDVNYERVVAAMEQIERGWDLIEYQVRSETDEYSLWFVFKLGKGREHRLSFRDPKPNKTAAVIRYGAQGDMIQMSSILPGLKAQGYHVTVYCQAGAGHDVVKHDPHIDRFIIQGKDEVPPQFLGEFWAETRKKYDKWINLCESVEATLLAAPGSTEWEWPNEVRAKYCDRNYLEFTHELAGVPPPYQPKFYSTLEERAWARKTAARFGHRNILWSLAGSSGHKVWPWLDQIIARVMLEYPDTHVILTGDDSCKLLEQGWGRFDEATQGLVETEPRVHLRSGRWTIRESMTFAEVADIIIGTETGLLNAAGSMDAWKIITLSHSSPEMLTKHWKNVIPLQQPAGVGCAKHPCRQLHGGNQHSPWEDCPQEPTEGVALCQFHVGPDMMWAAIQRALGVPVAIQRRAA